MDLEIMGQKWGKKEKKSFIYIYYMLLNVILMYAFFLPKCSIACCPTQPHSFYLVDKFEYSMIEW